MNETARLPVGSVVVPVWNAGAMTEPLLKALLGQDMDPSSYEILAVDNGSTDGTLETLQEWEKQHPGRLRVLCEHTLRGSYAARNQGIRNARGRFLAFTDADCVPDTHWLRTGVEALEAGRGKWISGPVRMTPPPNASTAHWLDAAMHMRNELLADRPGGRRPAAVTANLMVRRELFDRFGLFPGDSPSGADTWWTERLADAGVPFHFEPGMVVTHPTRGLWELLGKRLRMGRGKAVMAGIDPKLKSPGRQLRLLLRFPSAKSMRTLHNRFPEKKGRWFWLRVWLLLTALQWATAWGVVLSVVEKPIIRWK